MKSHRRAAACAVAAAALLPATIRAAAETYAFDPANTFVQFEVRHFGTSTLRGRFGPLQGQVMIDAQAGRGRLGLAIPLASLNTGFKPLDSRLKEPDLLDATAQPIAWFVAERFRFDGDRLLELRGEFTLRGVSVPLSLRALRFACSDATTPPRRCGGDFEGELLRSEFGATFGLPFVADEVRLKVQVEALRLADPQR